MISSTRSLEWLKYSPEPILVSNADNEIIFINQLASSLLEDESSQLSGKKLNAVLIDFDLNEFFSEEKNNNSNSCKKTGLIRIRKTDGEIILAEVAANAVRIEGENYLITSIRKYEQSERLPVTLTEQYKLLVKTINKLPEGIQILDRNLRYLYLNDIVVQQSKYSRQELLGFTMQEKYPGVEKSIMYQTILDCLKDGQPRNLTNEFVFPDKTIGFFYLNIEPIPEGVFIISLDISEIIHFREELIEKNRKLELMNIELEQFAYIASHDLQEPLKTISSCVRMLDQLLEGKTEKETKQLLQFIGSATSRMQELILALLEYSRIGKEIVRERVDCMELLNQVKSDMQTSIKETNCIISSDTLPVITASRADLRMLFQNLISNAVKFRKSNIPPEIQISSRENANYWIFSVRDNGIGIEEKYLEKIFAIFQRLHLKKEYEGTGIGLARCKKIVQLHGGDIWVESQPGTGSCFSFSLSKKIPA